jgi:hypothetical protein
VLAQAWESHDPRPRQPYIAAEKVLIAAERAGWTLDDIEQYLLDEGFPVSGASLDVWRKRRRVTSSTRPVVSSSTQAAMNVIARRRAAAAAAGGAS